MSWRGPLLKNDLGAELDLARRADDGGDRPRIAGPDGRVRQVELRVVEDVEGFGAELDLHAVVHREVLEEREVEVHAARSVQDVAAGVAEGEVRGRGKGRCVAPAVP